MISFTNSFANRAGEARPGADLGPFGSPGLFGAGRPARFINDIVYEIASRKSQPIQEIPFTTSFTNREARPGAGLGPFSGCRSFSERPARFINEIVSEKNPAPTEGVPLTISFMNSFTNRAGEARPEVGLGPFSGHRGLPRSGPVSPIRKWKIAAH